jgi:hypothetical protein
METVSDHRAESLTVNAAGLVQGIALVTFPAASGIFTSSTGYDLTSSQYGLMFAPQVVTAIVASLLGAGLLWPRFTARVSEKGTYLAGLVADLAAMVLLLASWGLPSRAAYHGLPSCSPSPSRSSRRCRITRRVRLWPPSASPGSVAPRCCRSRSASARRSWPATRPRWRAGSSRATRAGTVSPRSALARWSVRGFAYPGSSRPARG